MLKLNSAIIAVGLVGSFLLLFQNCSPAQFSQSLKSESPVATSTLATPPPTDVVCTGVSASADCNPVTSKVTAEIYALNENQRALHGADGVDTYFNFGDKISATVLMDQIFIPTRSFSTGFPVTNAKGTSYLVNGDGKLLMEYFALRLKTNLSLAPGQAPGLYQLALLSDDGSRLRRLDTGEMVVDNNSTHSTMLGCGTTVQLSAGQSIPLQLDYYQGPAEEIALTLLWRKVSASDAKSLSDPLCGVAGDDRYFGPTQDDQSAKSGYGQLLSRGWSVVPAANLNHSAAN